MRVLGCSDSVKAYGEFIRVDLVEGDLVECTVSGALGLVHHFCYPLAQHMRLGFGLRHLAVHNFSVRARNLITTDPLAKP